MMAAANIIAFDEPAVEWTGRENLFAPEPYTLGFRFRVSSTSDIKVAALGAFDLDGDGLRFSHIVAIWRLGGGDPIASAIVPRGTVAFLEGHFRYVNITPVRLFKDTEYVIGASDYGGENFVYESAAYNAQGFTNSSRIAWLAAREKAAVIWFGNPRFIAPKTISDVPPFRYAEETEQGTVSCPNPLCVFAPLRLCVEIRAIKTQRRKDAKAPGVKLAGSPRRIMRFI